MLVGERSSGHEDVAAVHEITAVRDDSLVQRRDSVEPAGGDAVDVATAERGIARPFVVGKVDVGYGDEGVAIFTGLNYPF